MVRIFCQSPSTTCRTVPVSDGGLRFHGEENCSAEVVDVSDARLPVVVVRVRTVAVSVGDGVPQSAEEQPADEERGTEDEGGVAPAEVDHGGEGVDEVVKSTSGDVRRRHVAGPVLEHKTPAVTTSVAVGQSIRRR